MQDWLQELRLGVGMGTAWGKETVDKESGTGHDRGMIDDKAMKQFAKKPADEKRSMEQQTPLVVWYTQEQPLAEGIMDKALNMTQELVRVPKNELDGGKVNPFLLDRLDFTPAFWEIVNELGIPSSWYDKVLVRQDVDAEGRPIGVEKKVSRMDEIEVEGMAREVPLILMQEKSKAKEITEQVHEIKKELDEIQLDDGEEVTGGEIEDWEDGVWSEDGN